MMNPYERVFFYPGLKTTEAKKGVNGFLFRLQGEWTNAFLMRPDSAESWLRELGEPIQLPIGSARHSGKWGICFNPGDNPASRNQ